MDEGRNHWSSEVLKCLLETSLEEVARVGRRGGSLQKESWAKLGKVLKERFKMDLNQKQIRNAYDNLKAKYSGWVYLRNKTGNIYNPATQMFTMSSEDWEAFRKGHPKAGSLRNYPLPNPDLCTALFDGASATGNNKWTSTQAPGASSSSNNQRVLSLQIENDPFDGLDDDDVGDSHQQSSRAQDEVPTTEEGPSDSYGPNVDSGRPKKKAKTSVNLDDLAMDMQIALRHMVKSNEGPSITECYERLKLVGLEATDPIFLAAFNIFGQSTQMREAWMTLPADPEVLKGWIKLTGATLGIFK